MNKFERDIHKAAQKTTLTTVERAHLRERVESYLAYHPVAHTASSAVSSEILPSPAWSFRVPARWLQLAAGAVAVIVFVVVPFAAERSVPGEVLYLIKTGVNENLQTQFSSTPLERAQLETRLIERRIAEARLLASEGKLTPELETQIAETVREHTKSAQAEISTLRETDTDAAVIAEISLDTTLAVQTAVLNETASSSPTLLSAVETARETVQAERIVEAPSFPGLLARMEQETTRAYELFTTVRTSATAEETTDIERRLADIDRLIIEAQSAEGAAEGGGIEPLKRALAQNQKLITFMTDIDVRSTVALETLVPVVLTQEEKVAQLNTEIQDLRTQVKEIEDRLTRVTDDSALAEKVTAALDQIALVIPTATSTVTGDDYETVVGPVTDARAVALDLLRLTAGYALPVAVDEVTDLIVPTSTPTSTPDFSPDSTPEAATSTATSSPTDLIPTPTVNTP
jgi:hypothetical protein